MFAYIDLSIIVFVFNHILSFIYSLIIFDNLKYNLYFIIQSILLSIIALIINMFLIPYFYIFFTLLYALMMAIFSLKYFKAILMSIVLFYINYGFLLLIGGCYFYDGLVMISTPFVTLFILCIPLYITLIHIIQKKIYNYIKDRKFKIKCKIIYQNNIIKGHGYYDTGNALLYENIPVIFIQGKPIDNNGKVIHIQGINSTSFTYLAYKAKLSIKDTIKDVYIVFIGNKHNFFNCSFLLNKYVL